MSAEADGTVIAADPAAHVSVRLWMPAHGHGSSPVTVAPEVSETSGEPVVGGFIASDVFFVMSGDWDIEIHLQREGVEIAKGVIQHVES